MYGKCFRAGMVMVSAALLSTASVLADEPRSPGRLLLFDRAETLSVGGPLPALQRTHFVPVGLRQIPDRQADRPEFQPPGVSWLPELANAQEQEALINDAQRYLETLSALEVNGAWHDSLTQELMSLGTVQQRLGEHDQAVEVFERATHLARVNQGLYTLQQMPALDQRVASHIAMGEWEEADQQQQYKFHVYTRALEADDPAMIPVMEELAEWNMVAYFLGLDEFPPDRLFDAYSLYGAALRLSERNPDAGLERRIDYLNRLAATAYIVARNSAVQYAGMSSAGRHGSMEQLAMQQPGFSGTRLYRTNGYSQGEAALQHVVELYDQIPTPDESVLRDKAEAIARLGDWYLLFDRRGSANEAYTRAWHLLHERSPEQARVFFDMVPVLPQFPTFNDARRLAVHEAIPAQVSSGHIDVEMTVNRFGRISGSEVVALVPAGSEQVSNRLMRDLRDARARPRVVDGEVVDTERVVMRFPYWY